MVDNSDRNSMEHRSAHTACRVFKGAWGHCPQQASREENHKGIFFSAGLCVLTQALLASFLRK